MSTDKPQVLDAQEAETIETGKPVEYYQAWVDGLKAD
jgi:hypothetical protein